MPRVSVGLPVYNGEEFLAQAIQSILEQDFPDFELVITDNASTDSTEEICRGFAARDPRIRYIRNARNLGAAHNYNLAFNLSSSEFFKWAAHDDFIGNNFLSVCVRALDGDTNAVLALPRLRGIDQGGALTGYEERPLPDMSHDPPAQRFRTLITIAGCDAAAFGLWRQDALARTSLHEPYFSSDCVLLAEAALLGHFVSVPDAVLYNREHPKRSVNLHSTQRMVWQEPDTSRRNPFELSRRIAHLFKVAYKHRDRAPLLLTSYFVASWVIDPLLIGRLLLEYTGAVSPRLREWLRQVGLRALKSGRAASRPSA